MAQTKIAGLFLDPTVISGLTAITDGVPASDYLFVWDAGTSTLKKILPNHLGLAAAAHTIESHDATSATGANLETLTNAGDADALHTHALKAPLASPTFTGIPIAPTQAGTDDSTRIATTAHVKDVKIDDFAAGDDNADLDSSTSRHGLLLKLGGGTTNFLRADGAWAAAGGGLSTAVRDFIDNGTSQVLYFMGGTDWRILTEGGNKSITNIMGLGFTAQASSSAYVQSSTTIRGGWRFISSTGNTSFAAAITKNDLDPTDDWTILWRGVVPSAATQVFQVGIVNGSTWSPPNEANQIGIRVTNTGNFFGYTDSGGTETTIDFGVAPSTTIRSLKIVITGGGTSVEYFIDDVSKGSITNHIPTGTTFLIQAGIETRTTATREIHVADFAAYRDA